MINAEAIAQGDIVLRRQIKAINVVVLLVLAMVLIGPFVFQQWFSRQYPTIDEIAIEGMQIAGNAQLCPGDTLTVTYLLNAKGTGVLVRDATVWNVTPPKTVIFSNSRRFITDGATREQVAETWHVPDGYLNTETDLLEPLLPGAYRRYVAIAALRPSGVVTINYVDFTIREDCK